MTLSQALSYTGNQYQAMSYDELAEVTKAFAEAARKRISRQQEGPAYQQLVNRALGRGTHAKSPSLNIRNGKVMISQKFKGKGRIPMNELRTLRKDLYNFLKNPTSTKTGLKEFREEAERIAEEQRRRQNQVTDIGDQWMNEPLTEWDLFDYAMTNSDLIYFGKEHLSWASGDIKTAIMSCGGYGSINNEALRRYVQERLTEAIGPRPMEGGFFYDEEV